MFIYSLKASTLKFIAIVVISIGLLITLISVIPQGLILFTPLPIRAETEPKSITGI